MTLRKFVRRSIVGIVIVLVAGYGVMQIVLDCGPPLADQSQQRCVGKHPEDLERPRPGVVLTLRLTDNGELVDRCEQTDAYYEVNWNQQRRPDGSYRIKVTPDAKLLPKFVVVYVHGWKNDERTSEGDYPKFKDLVGRLAFQHYGAKQVVGIYLSWKATAPLFEKFAPFLENVTFWDRMGAADRITQSGTLTKFISGLESILSRDGETKNQLVVIGHSFGARMAFSATIQNLLRAAQREHPGSGPGPYGLVRGSADAVILLNPAFEASLFTSVDSIFRKEEQFQDKQPPVLLSISSNNDTATGWWFPIGQRLALRSKLQRTTLGYYQAYQTHTLRRTTREECVGAEVGSFHLSEKFYLASLCTAPLPRRSIQPYNPFLVIQTDKTIIDGHSGIWSPTFSDWLFQLVKELGERHETTEKSIPGT